jgi:S1-C subfamily serine protease
MKAGRSINRWWALLGLLAASGIALALPPDQIFDRAAAFTWQVRALAADEKLLTAASGIAVAPGKLLTSCQVLARARQLQLRRGNTIYDAKLEFPDVERDLCQLDVPGLASPAPALGSARTLRPGQRLYVIGYGVGNAVSIGEGLVSAVHDAGAASERIQTTIPAARGLLGAGVYDEEARLVGVVTTSPKEAAAVTFAVPADWVPEIAARGAAALAARSKPAAAASATGGTAAPGLPAAGTSWTYAHVDRQYSRRQTDFNVQVLRVDGAVVEEAVSASAGASARRVVNSGELRILEQPFGSNVVLTELAPYLIAANGGKAPADPGRVSGYPIGGAGLAPWIYRALVQDWEQLTVPAGTFRVLRVEVNGDRERPAFTNVNNIGRFRITAWYAPEVKRYVRLEHRTWSGSISGAGQQSGDEAVELLKYIPGS